MGVSKIYIKVSTYFRLNPKSSLRAAGKDLGISKSSVGRYRQEIESNQADELQGFFATESGYQFLSRLVALVVFFFGIQRGIGYGSLSFFSNY